MKTILVTGGAGYIGSHTVLALLKAKYNVVVLDNLSNACKESLVRVEQLARKPVHFIQGDILDSEMVSYVFCRFNIDAVMHFAGLKAVGESVENPLAYYQNNVQGTMNLLAVMSKFNCNYLVFSSSATVYGEQNQPPYHEHQPLGTPTSPYGKSKLMVEQVLMDYCQSNANFKAIGLRYFNPIGADSSGQIGEDPTGIPNNLLPYIAQVAVGKREKLSVFGDDYPTPDGSCLRDYIHVTDLADGHVKALEWMFEKQANDYECINLGTGKPISVFEIINAFEQQTGQKIPFEIAPRRKGDLPAFWADATKAKQLLNWQASKSIADMMLDTWRWQSNNPNGFVGEFENQSIAANRD